MRKKVLSLLIACSIMAMALTLTGCASSQSSSAGSAPSNTRVVVDAYGRHVTLPANINTVAPVGGFPLDMSFILAAGEGDKVNCGLPPSFGGYQDELLFAPQLATDPVVQDNQQQPDMEQLLKLKPDVVITDNQSAIEPMENAGLTVVGINYEDFNGTMNIMGDVFNKQQSVNDFLAYLVSVQNFVKQRTDSIPDSQKVRVLYFDKNRMVRPTTTAEWWIPAAGGISVTQGDPANVQLDYEALLKANPDVIIELLNGSVAKDYQDPNMKNLNAVKNHQVYASPACIHVWGNWTSEQPMMILWAAQKFYPDRFKDVDMVKELGDFYKRFYNCTLTTDQLQQVFNGVAGEALNAGSVTLPSTRPGL